MSRKGRNILLVEPGYRTKFPPMGLMKLSTYHKSLGDTVRFVKGIKKSEQYSVYFDRIYVSTLFTYNWKITINTINYYKVLVDGDPTRIKVGGIMASLLPDDVYHETGIEPTTGLLDEPDPFGDGNKTIIDTLIPDYGLFDKAQIQENLFGEKINKSDHNYTLVNDSYFGYGTKGCIRHCEFCGVPRLEPKYVPYLDLKAYVNAIKEKYGEKYNLVLFDNNILASKNLPDIIRDIKDLGFEKGATIEYKNKYNQTHRRSRFVDFNQGVDARIMVEREDKVKLIKDIAINPLRIAFDHIKDKYIYVKAVKLAAKYEIRDLSNYILYNWDDTPQDLWKRLKINIDLNKELNLNIYSFPMKYIPLDSKDRGAFISKYWNYYFIRGVQRILNVLKGSVMTSEDFFYRAFGKDVSEFIDILHMPEAVLMYRGKEPWSLETEWYEKFYDLKEHGKDKELLKILQECRQPNDFREASIKTKSAKIKNILEMYLLTTDEVKKLKSEIEDNK